MRTATGGEAVGAARARVRVAGGDMRVGEAGRGRCEGREREEGAGGRQDGKGKGRDHRQEVASGWW